MTPTQKRIIDALLSGATIYYGVPGQIRLRDTKFNPVLKIQLRSFRWMKKAELIKKSKQGLWVIDKRKVRSLHGNFYTKKLYKTKLKFQKDVRVEN